MQKGIQLKNHISQRELGTSGLFANPMALGCYSMSNACGTRSDAESLQAIRRAIDQGINITDTADFYGWGHNEALVASALHDYRPCFHCHHLSVGCRPIAY